MSIKDKYQRSNSEPPKRKGNADIISKIVNNNQTINTEIQQTVDTVIQKGVNEVKKVKKATFELDSDLHKRLRVFATLNDTTMVDIVEKAIIDYLEKMDDAK